jgi:iron complex transport system substrate-binding protein
MKASPRKNIRSVLAALLVTSALAGLACSTAAPSTPRQVGAFGAKATAAQPQKAVLTYAKGFAVEHLGDGYKKVFDGEGRELLLVPRGKQVPDQYKNLPTIQIPVQKVVVLSGTVTSLLRPLDVLDTIVATNQDKEFWYIEEVKTGLASGKVQFVGRSTALDYEKLLSLKPDVVFTYTRSGNMNEVLTKLDELRIPAAVDLQFLENHPLGRLEWIKFLAAFYNKDEEARIFFEQSEKHMEAILTKTRKASKPNVLWAIITMDGKAYVAKGGDYTDTSIELAGGNNLFKDLPKGEGSAPITAEELVARGMNADLWINSHQIHTFQPTIKDLVAANPYLRDLPAIKEGKVWKLKPWWYQTLDKTDEQIQDLAAIFHPELFPGYELKHLSKMPKE